MAAAGVHQTTGNTEGKETRFGDPSTALFGVSSTVTSTGSADGAYDSFTPIGGFGLLTGIMLGEVTPGGTGSQPSRTIRPPTAVTPWSATPRH